MFYYSKIPNYPLSQFVECFWLVQFTSKEIDFKLDLILPKGEIELIISLGSPQKLLNEKDHDDITYFKKGFMSGLQKESLLIAPADEADMVGIRFKPGGLFPFIDMPVSEVTNQVVDMDLIWGPLIEEIREQLFELSGPHEKFNILQTVLIRRSRGFLQPNKAVNYATYQILNGTSPISVRELARNIGISHKHLLTQFNKCVGITPKMFYRVHRFQKALQYIEKWETIDWISLVYDCGYYDQAHFIREFKSFSGLTPSQYISHKNDALNHILIE